MDDADWTIVSVYADRPDRLSEIGIDVLYPGQISEEQATGILDRLRPVSFEDLADADS